MKKMILAMLFTCIIAIIVCDSSFAQTMNGGSTHVDTLNAVVLPIININIKSGSSDPAILSADYDNNQAIGSTILQISSDANWNLKGSAPKMKITGTGHEFSSFLQALQSGTGASYVDLDNTHDMYVSSQSPTTSQDFGVNYKQPLTGSIYVGTYTTVVTWTVTPIY